MSITIADDRLVHDLSRTASPVEIRTQDGRVLGLFTPRARLCEPDISDEELDRLLNDPNTKWYTAAEVEAKLRELRCTR
jgi:hypothetical protein